MPGTGIYPVNVGRYIDAGEWPVENKLKFVTIKRKINISRFLFKIGGWTWEFI